MAMRLRVCKQLSRDLLQHADSILLAGRAGAKISDDDLINLCCTEPLSGLILAEHWSASLVIKCTPRGYTPRGTVTGTN
eukprot:1650424-Rhodomonas_salina.2